MPRLAMKATSAMSRWGVGFKPGLGVCKELHAVGDLFITGIVAGCSHYDPMMLQSIRLALVMQLADCISAGIGLVENFCLDAASV